MACFHPLQAFQCAGGDVVFVDNLRRNDIIRTLQLSCGQCIGCRLERSRQWAVRCMHEAQLHEHNSFITLTYNDEHLPEHSSLQYRDFQLFMKRLRKHAAKKHAPGPSALHAPPGHLLTKKIRFYMCGEYGDERQRPHFHACLFGHDFDDKIYYKTSPSKAKLYTSEKLQKIWGKGHTTTGALTFESAAYTARYVMKKITGQQASASYEKIDPETGEIKKQKPEFNNMSRRPGIGKNWIEKYQTDVYPLGMVIVNGHPARPPRYYDKHFKKADLVNDQVHYEKMIYQRHKEAQQQSEHQTDQRLAAREQVTIAKTSQLKRTLT